MFGLNPFLSCMKKGITPLQYACIKGRTNIVRYFIQQNLYTYENGRKTIDVKKKIKQQTGILENSALHYAVQYENIEVYHLLIQRLERKTFDNVIEKDYLHLFNYKGYDALEMSKKTSFVKLRKQKLTEFEHIALQQTSEIFFENSYSKQNMQIVNEGFQFCLQGISNQKDYKDSILYKQLKNIKKTWTVKYSKKSEKIQIKVIKCLDQSIPKNIKETIFQNLGNKDGESGLYVYYYLINIPDLVLSKIADYLDIEIFHKELKYTSPYTTQNRTSFMNFKDYHIHTLILFILNSEFNLEFYIHSSIIINVIPLHEFRTRKMIGKVWNKEKYQIFFDNYKFKASSKDLRPINAIAYYYGCDYAFYISFLILMTVHLLTLTIVGAIIVIINIVKNGELEYDTKYTPIYGLIVSLWVVYIIKQTYRRNRELSKIWNTNKFEQNQIQRIDFKGQYGIQKVSKKVQQKDIRNIFVKRIIFEILILFVGIFLVVGLFLGITYFNEWANDRPVGYSIGGFDRNQSISFLTACSGAVNGVLITVFTLIFNYMAYLMTEQENHKYQSNYDNSLTLKMFIFQFFVSYTNLFYYIYSDKDIDLLSNIYSSLLISKNLAFLVVNDVLPHLIFLFKKRSFEKEWFIKRRKLKIRLCKQKNIELLKEDVKKRDFKSRSQIVDAENFIIKDKQKNGYKDQFLKINEIEAQSVIEIQQDHDKLKDLTRIEKKLILQDQIELTMLMPQPLNLNDLWIYVIIQFGFVTFFSISQPIINFWSFFANCLHIYYTYYAFITIYQRKRCKERESIGIWNTILIFMGIIAVMNNFGIMHYASSGVDELLSEDNAEDKLLAIVLVEHVIFLIVFCYLMFTPNQPTWVKKKNKKEDLKKRIKEDNQKAHELKEYLIKHQNMRRIKLEKKKQKKLRTQQNFDKKFKESMTFQDQQDGLNKFQHKQDKQDGYF